jgi:DNA modification methylase
MQEIRHGDCLSVMREMPDASVDAVVTDPPYGLAFMGKRWDYDVPSVDIWAECLRILKPGGHLLAFAGTRTQHRMAVRIEDAGFEIRDMIAWVYGSGFPKSLDVSKAIDKRGGSVAGFEQFRDAVRAAMKRNGVSRSRLQAALGNHMLGHYLTAGSQPAVPNLRDYRIIRDSVQLGPEFDALFNDEAERDVVGRKRTGDPVSWYAESVRGDGLVDITAPATPEAQQWAGWGTALKPALEPITVARKPLVGTVAANVLEHGTGALNVDGCRVLADDGYTENAVTQGINTAQTSYAPAVARRTFEPSINGRWPANLIHDGSEEVVGLLNDAARFFYCAKASKADRDEGCEGLIVKDVHRYGAGLGEGIDPNAPARNRNHHPTVKPTDLMRYLCRLVTPPGGIVLDPFAGSGSTGKAAALEGFRFIGIEREAEYVEIARARIAAAVERAGLFERTAS